MRTSPVLLLVGGLLLAITAYGMRYEPPAQGRLVLNAAFDGRAAVSLPLRLSRGGRYYAELLLEAADGGQALPATPLTVGGTLRVRRAARELFARPVALSLSAAMPGGTVTWLEVPRDLPQRRRMVVEVVLAPPAPPGYRYRLQLTRKLEQPLFSPR